jgi:hypothetical protein
MTPAFGLTDPADPSQWSADIEASSEGVRLALRDLAEETGIGFLDMSAYWGSYVVASGQDVSWYKRDNIHANARGEQILGHVLTSHLNPYANGDDCASGPLAR